MVPTYARGGGGHGGGGRHAGGGRSGGAVRGGFSGGGFRGGVVNRGGGGIYRAPYYGPSLYFGVGGGNYYPSYYGYYDPYYYGYDPYVYGGDLTYSAPPPQAQPQQPQAQPEQPQAQAQPSAVDPEGKYYLIAFSDHSIQAATAYKVDGDQFHWIGLDGKEKQVPLSSVDIPFSQQMNRDRHVDLQIP
jgi:hypothetical protein